MKNQLLKSTGLACLIASMLAAVPLSALAQTTQPTTPALVAPPPDTNKINKNVSGKVEAKSDTTLTVGGRTVSTGSSTTFSKAGASIGSGDVKVGDKVNIVTSDDGQVAVSVDVISSD
jgi:hypothetical protein